MFNNLTIKSRLIFIIGLMSIFLLSIGLLGLYGISKANEGLRSVYEDRTIALGQVAKISDLLQRNRLRIVAAILTPTHEMIRDNTAEVEKNIGEIGKTWDAYMATYLTADEKKLADQFAEDRKKFVATGLKPAIAALRDGDIKETTRIVADVIRPLFQPVGEGVAALQQLQLDVAKHEYEQAQSSYATIRNVVISAIVIGVGLSLWIGFILIRAIVNPINEAVAVANAVASGDLTSKIEAKTNDETGLLIKALKSMNDNLIKLVSNVRTSADSITTGAGEIAAGNADLSQRTEEQASSLEETAASMEELTSTVRQNAENAKQANQLAKGASEIAMKGGEVVGQVVGTMSSINDSSRKIVDIISVIDGIAFQTNILALNAAVEAARAGEQGRGFAVVAAEVRNLAQRSAAAAKEIKTLIGDSVGKVEDGTRLVDEAGKTMAEIVNAVKRVTDIMSEISAASNEQSTGIEQVNQAVMQMDEVTQQNAALVEEAAAAAESVEEQAQLLTEAVGIFKLDNSSSTQQASRRIAAAPQRTIKPAERQTFAAASKKPAAKIASKAKALPAKSGKPDDGEWEEF
jgi:methyl-accepting chemotaxis protein